MFRRFEVACATKRKDNSMILLLTRMIPQGASVNKCSFTRYGPSREKVNLKRPQSFQIYKFKNIISTNYDQSEAEVI